MLDYDDESTEPNAEDQLRMNSPVPPSSPARLNSASSEPKQEHCWKETRTIALGRHIKQICVNCGIETFEDVRRISMRLPCVKRELAPDQIAELEAHEEADESESGRRWIFLAIYLALFVVAVFALYRVASGAW